MAVVLVFFGNSGEANAVAITLKAPQNEKVNQYNLVEKKKKKGAAAKPKAKPKIEEEEGNSEADEGASLEKSNEGKGQEDNLDYSLADILKAAENEDYVVINPEEDQPGAEDEKQPQQLPAKKGKKKAAKKNAKPAPAAPAEDEEAEEPAPKKTKGKKKPGKKGKAQLL